MLNVTEHSFYNEIIEHQEKVLEIARKIFDQFACSEDLSRMINFTVSKEIVYMCTFYSV